MTRVDFVAVPDRPPRSRPGAGEARLRWGLVFRKLLEPPVPVGMVQEAAGQQGSGAREPLRAPPTESGKEDGWPDGQCWGVGDQYAPWRSPQVWADTPTGGGPVPTSTIDDGAVGRTLALQTLLVRCARRVAWGGDGRRGTARIEVGEGALAGAVLVVSAVDREIDVEISLPDASLDTGWRERVVTRLRRRGFTIRRFEVG